MGRHEAEQYQRTIDILCQECQTPQDELHNDTAMADLLTDPLLSVAISARLKKELQLDVSADDLVNLRAISDLKTTLLGSTTPALSEETSPTDSWNAQLPLTPADLSMPMRQISIARQHVQGFDEANPASSHEPMKNFGTPSATSMATPLEDLEPWAVSQPVPNSSPGLESSIPPAKSVVLQGKPGKASRAVFLFPDGSGSERPYVNLPRIALDLVVFGLQCPFLKRPADMSCTWGELVHAYIAEIRKRQPEGPYDFVGYAAGGTLAFHAAQLLVLQGEEISSLTLIDSPVPEVLGHLSDDLFEYIRSVRAWRNGGHIQEWVLPHLKAFTKLLNTYVQSRCPVGAVRKVNILWAGHGVSGVAPPAPAAMSDGEKRVVDFLTKQRTDFGPCGWEVLLPGSLVSCAKIDADHFEMMMSEHAPQVSICIAEALQ